jgi:SNF2 family DNA or RNA helicase
VDGERVDLVPALVALLEADGADLLAADADDDDTPIFLPLSDGRILAIALARVRPILSMLQELFAARGLGPGAGRLGISRLEAAALAALDEAAQLAGLVWQGGEGLRTLGRILHETGGIPAAAVPKTFHAELRPYQARGVAWLQFLRSGGFGGVLADDMGLGKTVQTLAHLAIEKAEGRLDRPALVVCPTSLVANWRRETARFVPDLRVLALHGPGRKARFGEIAAHDLVITTYPLVARDHEALTAQPWHVMVLDEAHTIKNPDAITTRLVARFDARQRLCLSGTPLENHLGELWSLFTFLAPGFLGDRKSFARRFRTPIEKQGDRARRDLLARRVRPFLLRRTKEEVAADLPPKTEIIEAVEMAAAQQGVYESIRLAMHTRVREAIAAKGLTRSSIVILDALLKLRQACCDPRLLKLKTAEAAKARSAKLERLLELIPTLIDEGRRILVFSQFTSMLALIEAELDTAGLPYLVLTGQTRNREGPVRRFQSGEVPLFLISLKAGGTGLNLTAADTVIHYDPWWNPAVEDQATDRAHRIGQDKAVFVHRLVTLGTIEEKMEELKGRKRALVAGIVDAERGGALALSESDIETLFAPMSA